MPEEHPNLGEAIGKISNALYELQCHQGINKKAVIALLRDSTKLPRRTIVKVIDGLNDLAKQYCQPASAPPPPPNRKF